jgi:BRCT domain type II-containing protein
MGTYAPPVARQTRRPKKPKPTLPPTGKPTTEATTSATTSKTTSSAPAVLTTCSYSSSSQISVYHAIGLDCMSMGTGSGIGGGVGVGIGMGGWLKLDLVP